MAQSGMSGMISLAQMLGGARDDATPSFPTKEAQRDALRQVIELSNREGLRFKKGDPVHYLGGMGPMTKVAKEGLSFVFWRYLDPENVCDLRQIKKANPIERATLPDIDCLIASFAGQEVHFDLSCSWLLVPGEVPEEDRS